VLVPAQVTLTNEAARSLAAHGWPRNLVELEAIAHQLISEHPGAQVDDHGLPLSILTASAIDAGSSADHLDFEQCVDHLRRDLVRRSLDHCHGNARAAARYLKIGETTLRDLIRRFGLEAHATRP
jgi:DNA-binding NtrC family response regulator